MKPGEIEAYLHRQIPISSALGVRVTACDRSGATLTAPLQPNVNHRATVFGGSASAIAILVAWTWLHVALREAGEPARLVIQRNTMEYLAPIAGDFEARCAAPPAAEMEKFLRTYRRHGRARIVLAATLAQGGDDVATFSGEYVAVRTARGA